MNNQIKPVNIKIPQNFKVPRDYNSFKSNVKYGIIEDIGYQVAGRLCIAKVLLPPNYNRHNSYPTLYLLSGLGNNYEWTNIGHVDWLIGNLGNNVIDIIIVMPEILENACEPMEEKIKDYLNLKNKLPYLIDKVEERYPILLGRENRSIAGLSMGGMAVLYLSLLFDKTPYAFSTIGAISPSDKLFEWWLDNKESLPFDKQKDYNFCLTTGTKDALLINGAKRYQRVLKEEGFESSFITIEGKGHCWDAFNPLFYAFIKYFFKRECYGNSFNIFTV